MLKCCFKCNQSFIIIVHISTDNYVEITGPRAIAPAHRAFTFFHDIIGQTMIDPIIPANAAVTGENQYVPFIGSMFE
jgi:hypothetical protein